MNNTTVRGYTKKGIKNHLREKIDEWLKTIKDEELKKIIRENVFLSGGAIVSLLQGETPNDYDLYFKTKESALAVSKYYVDIFNKEFDYKIKVITGTNKYNNKRLMNMDDEESAFFDEENDDDRIKIFIKSAGVASSKDKVPKSNKALNEEFKKLENNEEFIKEYNKCKIKNKKAKERLYLPKFLTSNAISLYNDIQLIIRFVGSPEEIHVNYDFVHTKNYYNYYNDHLELNKDALYSILTKRLDYRGSLYPLSSIIRAKKFIKRGWEINASQYVKMAMQISELNLSNPFILEDQLVGVDYTFFMGLIYELLKKKKEDDDFVIRSTYLSELIDKLFE